MTDKVDAACTHYCAVCGKTRFGGEWMHKACGPCPLHGAAIRAESEATVVALREALTECAEAMHDYAVGGESEDGFLHTTTVWLDCPGPECVAARAALAATPEAE